MKPFRLCMLVLPTLLVACSRPPTPPAAPQPLPATTTAAPTVDRDAVNACDLVTAKEMSAILGSNVEGVEPAHHASGKTECIYKPANAPSPYVEFSVEWGEGEAAMTAMGAMARAQPGMTSPYAGIGDQAAAVGTALMIRSGDDLVTITFSGVDDAPAKAKRIFDTARARM